MIVTFFFQHKQSDKLISFFEIDPIHVSEKITSDEYPDIYYIILDGYANSSVLENFFGYDNKEFLDFLHTKNFFIADKSTSNYGYTYASLASSLNMSYLDEFAEYLGPESHDLNALSYVIENNQVQKILMNQGYSLVYFSSGYPMTNFNKHAEISFGEGLDRFSLLLLNNTMLRVFIDPTSRWRFGYSRDDEVRKRLFFTSDTLSLVPEMSKIQTPRFVVSHIVLPHEPYVFDQYGNSVKSKTTYEPDEMTMRYREQLIYLNTHVEKIVDSLLEKSEIPPIIIIQSDHGATPAEITGEKYYKFYNFTAIHIPDSIEHTFYGSVTPVNIFRIIFNDLFETQFPILKDRVFVPENLWYDFREVTDLVRSETAYNSLLNSEEERIDQ
ncbi:MAG: hypothetical protein KAS07_00230 [Candidatus Pacebacteria bacterium]|nr:hypothetical protein [Candidatus Paceibacterota bacterium]